MSSLAYQNLSILRQGPTLRSSRSNLASASQRQRVVGVAESRDVEQVVVRFRPWVHDAIGAAEQWLRQWIRLPPDLPQAIDFGVMHPEDGIGRRGAGIVHDAAHPGMAVIVSRQAAAVGALAPTFDPVG